MVHCSDRVKFFKGHDGVLQGGNEWNHRRKGDFPRHHPLLPQGIGGATLNFLATAAVVFDAGLA